MADILIIHGPNLNLLGQREPEIYGLEGFEQVLAKLKSEYPQHKINYRHSNIEGELIDYLHEFGFKVDGIILNAGAYAHTSIGIGDAVRSIDAPVIEVHISNTFAREQFRHESHIAPHATGVIIGFGIQGYRLALNYYK